MLNTEGILDISMETKMDSAEQITRTSHQESNNWASDYDKHTRSWYQWNRELLPHFTPELFDTECPAKKSSDSGRGALGCFAQEGRQFILRHFNRGGWVRAISKDRYLLPVSSFTRVEAEVELLLSLRDKALPVPEPAAFRVQRKGVVCRMDIILRKITNAQNLVEALRERQLDEKTWRAIGTTIAGFHVKQICHSDLNAHNIMVDEDGQVWLVDFDKSCLIKGWPWLWQKLNLARLQRSLKKESRRNKNFYWSANDWQSMLTAYRHALVTQQGGDRTGESYKR